MKQSRPAIETSIVRGRKGVMLRFDRRLDNAQLILLLAWLTQDLKPGRAGTRPLAQRNTPSQRLPLRRPAELFLLRSW